MSRRVSSKGARPRESRSAVLLDHLDSWREVDGGSIYNALVSCLSRNEASECIMEDQIFFSLPLRRPIIRKVKQDASKKLSKCHLRLFDDLTLLLRDASGYEQQVASQILCELFGVLELPQRTELIQQLLATEKRSLMRRALKLMKQNWQEEYLDIVTRTWAALPTPFVAELMVEHAPFEILRENIPDLITSTIGTRYLTALFKKVQEHTSRYDNLLLSADPITYIYLLTKSGKRLSAPIAKKLYLENYSNERVGLLIWCYGQMGLWEVLKFIADEHPRLSLIQFKARLKESGIGFLENENE